MKILVNDDLLPITVKCGDESSFVWCGKNKVILSDDDIIVHNFFGKDILVDSKGKDDLYISYNGNNSKMRAMIFLYVALEYFFYISSFLSTTYFALVSVICFSSIFVISNLFPKIFIFEAKTKEDRVLYENFTTRGAGGVFLFCLFSVIILFSFLFLSDGGRTYYRFMGCLSFLPVMGNIVIVFFQRRKMNYLGISVYMLLYAYLAVFILGYSNLNPW